MTFRRRNPDAERVRKCLTKLISHQPFFGSLALRLPLTLDNKVQTLASDGETIRFSPSWVREATADQITAAMARVVMACTLKHHLRRGERHYGRWQEASELVTRPFIREAGLTDEHGGLDLSIEDAYETIPEGPLDDQDQQPQGMPGQPGGDQGNDNQDDGEDADGQDNPDPNGKGEIMDAPADADPQEMEQEWDEVAHQASQWAKAQGHAPGSAEQLLAASHR